MSKLNDVEAKWQRRSIDHLFGGRRRYLVVCEGGLYLHDPPPTPASLHTQKKNKTSQDSSSGFVAVSRLHDGQAVRAAEFHPSGRFYAVGSNSKCLRICAYPPVRPLVDNSCGGVLEQCGSAVTLVSRPKHHKGSVYCIAWNATGDLIATGSNDKTLRLLKFDEEACTLEDASPPLSFHGGTVRDACFMEDTGSRRSNLLISGGAGDNRIYVTDCETATPFQALAGHTGPILSLYTWGGVLFVSSSQDRTIRFWDMRSQGCVQHMATGGASACVSVDPSGRLLVWGCGQGEEAGGCCTLYDVRGSRILQTIKDLHGGEVRSARMSPHAYYLLTGSYDGTLALTDLQGDLTQPLSSVIVARHSDKVLRGRWHPTHFTFLSTSADGTAAVWAPPDP